MKYSDDIDFLKTVDPSSPVKPEMTSEMEVDILVNKDGKVYIFHDKPLPEKLEWLEYDVDDRTLHLISKGGRLQNLGMKIQPLLRKYMRNGRNAYVICVIDKKIHDIYDVALIVRDASGGTVN